MITLCEIILALEDMWDSPEEDSNGVTILQRRKKAVRISNQEAILMLRAYVEHPCSWGKIVLSIKENLHTLPHDAKNLYTSASEKQLRERLSTKFGKLLSQPIVSIKNDDIKTALQSVKDLEKKLEDPSKMQSKPDSGNVMSTSRDMLMESMPSGDEDMPSNMVRKRKYVNEETEDTKCTEQKKEKKKTENSKKRSFMDLARQNQEHYNKFITKDVPKLLKALGVSSSDSD